MNFIKYSVLPVLVVILLTGCATKSAILGPSAGIGGPDEIRNSALRDEILKQYLIQQELIKMLDTKIKFLELELEKYRKND